MRQLRQTGIVRLRNLSGQNLDRYSVLALRDPIVSPADNLQEFQNQVTFDGVAPAATAKCERFAAVEFSGTAIIVWRLASKFFRAIEQWLIEWIVLGQLQWLRFIWVVRVIQRTFQQWTIVVRHQFAAEFVGLL